jgi:DNA-binding IclR family transcriptional regulator
VEGDGGVAIRIAQRRRTSLVLAAAIGMPRTTVMSKLNYLIKRDHVRQDGNTYIVAGKVLATRAAARSKISWLFAAALLYSER